jgi:hemoglobin
LKEGNGDVSSAHVPRNTTRADLARLVDAFYADVFADRHLGPLFAHLAGERWPEHRARMIEFWSTTLLHTRSYRGNVMRKHVGLLPALQPAHFEHWLGLWRRHTVQQLHPDDAEELFATARGIARNLHLGCFGSLPW